MRSAVLAGGTASRFDGTPKGLEQVGDDRIIDRVVNTISSVTGVQPILIANAPEAGEWRPDLTVLGDAIQNCGSLGGLYTALMAGEGPVLVMAWDMPFVPPELIRTLIERFENHDACVPEIGGPGRGLEPLCAVYGPECIAPIREQLVDEDLRVTEIFGRVNAAILGRAEIERFGPPETLFFNVNTHADLKRAQELSRGDIGQS